MDRPQQILYDIMADTYKHSDSDIQLDICEGLINYYVGSLSPSQVREELKLLKITLEERVNKHAET